MPRINTERAADFIACGREFTTNGALSAHYDSGDNYVVRSYSTPILVWNNRADAVHLNQVKYSATTSGHQNIAAAAVGVMPAGTVAVFAYSDPAEFETATGYRVRVSKFATVN